MRPFVLLLLACQTDRRVEVLLGPTRDTPSSGYACGNPDPAHAGEPLIKKALDGTTLNVTLVIDLVDLGPHFPSCLGEDIEKTCSDGTCRLTPAVAPTRFCHELSVPGITDATTATAKVADYLSANFPVVMPESPHKPVIVRAVFTQQKCDELDTLANGVWPSLDPVQALGCAYSCPVSLDDAQGSISLGLDVGLAGSGAAACVGAVRVCAGFPSGTI